MFWEEACWTIFGSMILVAVFAALGWGLGEPGSGEDYGEDGDAHSHSHSLSSGDGVYADD